MNVVGFQAHALAIALELSRFAVERPSFEGERQRFGHARPQRIRAPRRVMNISGTCQPAFMAFAAPEGKSARPRNVHAGITYDRFKSPN